MGFPAPSPPACAIRLKARSLDGEPDPRARALYAEGGRLVNWLSFSSSESRGKVSRHTIIPDLCLPPVCRGAALSSFGQRLKRLNLLPSPMTRLRSPGPHGYDSG